jgi:methionine-rich copper-binding protein CopC
LRGWRDRLDWPLARRNRASREHSQPDDDGGAREAVMTLLRALLAAFLCATVSLIAPAPAGAHAVRIATEPGVDALLDSGPPQVSATFNEQLQATFAAMTVVGPDGNLWSTVGTYTVNYRVTSADSHVVTGSWAFRLEKPGIGTPGPPADAPTAGAIPWWPFAAAGALIVLAAALGLARRRT